MSKLSSIEPKEVFGFFENLCDIPHGSGNLQQISDFLVSFAKERNLEVTQDKELNVIIALVASRLVGCTTTPFDFGKHRFGES